MLPGSPSHVLTVARGLVAAGISIIPWRSGTKEPAYNRLPLIHSESEGRSKPSWAPFIERPPSDEEIVRWFADGVCGIAVVGGEVSGGLVILDLESLPAYEQWRTYAATLLPSNVLASLPVVRTGRGKHVYFRMVQPKGNQVLARKRRAETDERGQLAWEVLAETRGQGGVAITAPTLHPSGTPYAVEHGGLTNVPLLAADHAAAVLDAARALGDVELPLGATNSRTDSRQTSVIEAYNRAHDIRVSLEAQGYRPQGDHGYIRPGGEHASVLVVAGANRSLHFNSNDPLHKPTTDGRLHAQTPFNVMCELQCGGDLREAVRHAADQPGAEAGRTSRRVGKGAWERASPVPVDTSTGYIDRAATALALVDDHQADPTWPYFEEHDSNGLASVWMFQPPARDTPKPPLQLCNFTARISEETEIDDGEQRQERYTIVASCGERTRSLEMSREEFESDGAINRIVAALGAQARLNPRADSRFLRDAIKAFSSDVVSRTVYAYTGWVDDHRRFLFGNGLVDANGWQAGGGAQLPARLQQYQLDEVGISTVPITTALATFDTLLELAPPSVMIPLLGAVLLPPIAWTIGAPQPMVHLYGITGSHKTALTCAAMALWGRFSPAQPTDTWTSTPNSIQKLGWYLKDAPFLLDDYKAAHVKPAQVTFLLQNYGDGMARGRLDANAEARTAFPIRATLISSGEDQPEGEASALARILSVSLARGQVDRAKLTDVQTSAQTLPVLLINYLAWLATQPAMLAHNRDRHTKQRARLLAALEIVSDQATNPGRVASNVAALGVAWHTFGQFLRERGYWREERVVTWLGLCAQHLQQLAAAQVNLVTDERYSVQFFQTVRGLLATGRAQMQNLDLSNGEVTKPPALIGGYDHAGAYLLPAAYDEVRKYRYQMGMPLAFSQKALLQMLEQEGLFVTTDDKARKPQKVITRHLDGKRHRCWHLPPGIVFETDDHD